MPDIIQDIGTYAGLASVLGLAVLSALYFSQARDVKRLREWAGRAPERAEQGAPPVPGRAPLQPRAPAAPGRQPGQAPPVPGQPRPLPGQAAGAPRTAPVPAAAAATGARPAAATAAGQAAPAAAGAGGNSQGGTQAPEKPGVAGDEEKAAAANGADARPGGAEAGVDGSEARPDGAPPDGTEPDGEEAAAQSDDVSPPGDTDTADEEAAPAGETGEEEVLPEEPEDEVSDEPEPDTGDYGPPEAAPVPQRQTGPLPATPAGQRPGAPPVPVGGTRPPMRTGATRAVPGRPAPQHTQVIPPPRPKPWYRANPLYVVLAIAGVLIVGGAVAFGANALISEDDGGGGGGGEERLAGQPAGSGDGGEGDRPERNGGGAPVNPANVTVAVLNGTTVPGLAALISDQVKAAGFTVGTVANYTLDQQRGESVVMYTQGHEREARAVGRRVDVAQRELADASSRELAGDATVIVIAGADKTP